MLDSLITSKTRIKLLLKFFLNKSTRSYLRSLANEFNESTNSVRVELNKLTEAGILEAQPEGNTIMYKANERHPLFPEITRIVEKYFGFDQIIENILVNLGDLKYAYVVGDYAEGKDTGVINLVLVGEINREYLHLMVEKVEVIIKRKIQCAIHSETEADELFRNFEGQKLMIY